ncbi:MAG: hypothetical protein LQ343_001294 [Gyalolechia ehrenbergii]|nr:MAG: hypothetical protein LQ343_001294 [Gyalolechia ehrenbergii]
MVEHLYITFANPPIADPPPVVAPIILAAGAYLNARTNLLDDLATIFRTSQAKILSALREYQDHCNLFYTLERHALAKCTSNHPCLIYEGKFWTFREVYDTVLRYGTWLKTTYKVAPKEIVALDFMNRPEMIFIWLGLWSIGAYPAFINYNLTGPPLIHCLATSTARIVFVDGDVSGRFNEEVTSAISSPTFRDGKGPMEMIVHAPTTFSEIANSITVVREPDSARSGDPMDGMAALIFTSGTTGFPKAAIVSWAKITVGSEWVSRWLGLRRKDRFYTCMPLYHSTAAILGFGTCLVSGCTLVLGHRFSSRTFWPEVRDTQATVIQYVGETLRYLLAAPPQKDAVTGENIDRKNNVRIAFGNGLRPDVWKRFQDRFGIEGIAEFYSATEGINATWNLSRNDFAVGAIGRNGFLTSALLKSRSAIVQVDWETEAPKRDPKNDNFCIRVPRGQPGGLLFRIDTPQIARGYQGYLNNAKASESKIMRSVLEKDDVYFITGDVVRWDKEGRWWFCDRIGDTFRWKSENVSTAEVSEVLGTHPAIEEANVYGVDLPHHEGKAGCATVKCNDGVEADWKTLNGVAAHARERLPRYAVPLFLRVTKSMQATGNNKQQKHILRAQGVQPATIRSNGDQIYWLKGWTYEIFDDDDWRTLEAGQVKL